MEEDAKSILEVLGELLAPLGERRKKRIVGWVEREIQRRPIVQYVEESDDVIWRIGDKSPLNGDETIFAMFVDDANVISAYSFQEIEVEGQPGTTARYFYRSLIFKPVHVHGPIHHNALVGEFEQFIGDEEIKPDPDDLEDEPRANGGGVSA